MSGVTGAPRPDEPASDATALAYIGDRHGLLAALRHLIASAEQAIVLQMYLFSANGDQTLLLPRAGAWPLADRVADWLIAQKRARPALTIVVVLDSNTPANPALTRRGGPLVRQRLREAGVIVVSANLFATTRYDRRRRWLLRRMNLHLDGLEGVALPDHVEHQNRWQTLHNVEDHRKNLVIDGGRAGAVTSHNLLDPAWDWHENLLWLTGAAARELWQTALDATRRALELPQDLDAAARQALDALLTAHRVSAAPPPALADLSPIDGFPLPLRLEARDPTPDAACRLLHNEAIRPALEAMFAAAGPGDAVRVATTYLSDLPMLEALADAARRGASVRVLIDSIDALPLPPAWRWLSRHLVNHQGLRRALALQSALPDRFALRVHDSRAGAMMHLKSASVTGPRRALLISGQANYTPNAFNGAWLETDVETRAPAVIDAFNHHFEQLWTLPASRPLQRPRGLRSRLRSLSATALLEVASRLGIRP